MGKQDDGITRAPWTADEVASLNAYQQAGAYHPFTCGDDACRAADPLKQAPLTASPDGWRCPRCEYTQNWAHTWMTDGSWLQPADRMAQMVSLMSATHGGFSPGAGWRR
jgi:hypothetical protein